MKSRQLAADAELRPQSAKVLSPTDSAPSVTLTRAELRDLMRDAVVEALAEFELGKQPAPELLGGDQMALRLGISRTTLHRLRTEGAVPSVKVGDVYKFEPAAVMAALRGGR